MWAQTLLQGMDQWFQQPLDKHGHPAVMYIFVLSHNSYHVRTTFSDGRPSSIAV